jgi:hypothetical protein
LTCVTYAALFFAFQEEDLPLSASIKGAKLIAFVLYFQRNMGGAN